MCLSCGYRGRQIQGDRGQRTFQCPSCFEDLYARPARSYAEMEGLDDSSAHLTLVEFPIEPERTAHVLSDPTSRSWRTAERLLVAAVTVLIVCITVSHLVN